MTFDVQLIHRPAVKTYFVSQDGRRTLAQDDGDGTMTMYERSQETGKWEQLGDSMGFPQP